MKIRTLYDFFSNRIFLKGLFHADYRIQLPEKRILITADLDEPSFNSHVQKLIEMLSRYRAALTVFSPNMSMNGETGYEVLKRIHEFAKKHDLPLEIASHSMIHDLLGNEKIVETIRESVFSFRDNGMLVSGFRAPHLSTEGFYRNMLREIGREDGIIKYDSSVSFEGSLFISRMHDFFSWKSPHTVANIWELPISCLDDYHLFVKLQRDEQFVCEYWKRKIDMSLRKYNYFLLLVHPEVIGRRLSVLENIIIYCQKKHSTARHVTCLELVSELNKMKKRSDSADEGPCDIKASPEGAHSEISGHTTSYFGKNSTHG